MSVSSNIRKESTESHAARQMHSTMGNSPDGGIGQLNDRSLDNELPSRLNDRANNSSVAEDVEAINEVIAENDDAAQPAAVSDADQPVALPDADKVDPVTGESRSTHVADADWNQSTKE